MRETPSRASLLGTSATWPAWAASIAIVVLFAWRVPPMTPGHALFDTPADHHKYLYMAEQGAWSFHIAPFCWRPGVPFAVQCLPIEPQWGFYLLAMVCLALTGVVVYQVGRAFEKPPAIAAFGMLAFWGVGWAVKNPLFDFYLPDAAAHLIVWLSVYLVLSRRWRWLAITLCVGVVVKESVLFVAPLVVTLTQTPWRSRRTWTRAAAVVLPAVVVLLAVRAAIPAKNSDAAYVDDLPQRLNVVDMEVSEYDYAARVELIGSQRLADLRNHPIPTVHAYTIGAFGVLLFFGVVLDLRRNKSLLLRLSPFLLLVYGQLLFATDTQRLLVLGLPALVLPALNGAEYIAARLKRNPAQLLVLVLPVVVMSCVYADRVAGPTSVEAVVVACGFLILIARRGVTARSGNRSASVDSE